MKAKHIYLIITAASALLFGSCLSDEPVAPLPPTGDLVGFNISVPGEQVVGTRGTPITEGVIDNIHVLVFDQNGGLLSRTQAVRTGGPGQYNVRLAPTDPDAAPAQKRRFVHFVANYDWSGYSDIHNLGKHENEVIGNLSVADGAVTYWQRIELPNGIQPSAFPATIELIRNVAKISLTDASGALGNVRFATGDHPDLGTVAPFDSATLSFTEGAVFESPLATPQAISETDLVAAGTEILCYERKNSASPTPMYVILKGRYTGDAADSYYKIDFILPGGDKLLDIVRNHHYQIVITNVTGPGNATLAEAVNSAASNNLLYSLVLKDYPSISDGTSGISVETMAKTLVEPGKVFTIGYSYFPDIASGVENNTNVTFSLEQDPAKPVVDPSYTPVISRTPGKACYQLKTAAVIPDYEIYTARLVISATRGGVTLRRAVELRLRKPSVFSNIYITPGRVLRAVGQPVDFHFTTPDNIRTSQYPFEVFITTKQLSPNLAYTATDKLSLDYTAAGTYRYKYVVTHPGDHTVHFVTTANTTSETMILESELFTRAVLAISN